MWYLLLKGEQVQELTFDEQEKDALLQQYPWTVQAYDFEPAALSDGNNEWGWWCRGHVDKVAFAAYMGLLLYRHDLGAVDPERITYTYMRHQLQWVDRWPVKPGEPLYVREGYWQVCDKGRGAFKVTVFQREF